MLIKNNFQNSLAQKLQKITFMVFRSILSKTNYFCPLNAKKKKNQIPFMNKKILNVNVGSENLIFSQKVRFIQKLLGIGE